MRRMPRTYSRQSAHLARITAVFVLLIEFATSGCTTPSGTHIGLFSGTGPVVALIDNDIFVGQRTDVKIHITSTSRAEVSCVGENLITGSVTGHANIRCTDGTVAEISFIHSFLGSLQGYGYAETPNGPVSYTYGMKVSEAVKHLRFAPGTGPDLTGQTPRVRSQPLDSHLE